MRSEMNTSDGMGSGQNHFGDTNQPDDTNPRERLENNPERSLFEREITRREFVTTAAALTGGVCFGTTFPLQSAGTIAAKPESEVSAGNVKLKLRINGQSHSLSVDEITTVEGLAKGNNLHPIQAAFLEHDGFQCGYCTPGQICSAVALFDEHKRGDVSVVTTQLDSPSSPDLTPDEIRERMSGNICRCGAYPGIVSAIQSVAHDQQNEGSGE
jgi:aerobic-type carbon monoxide dehydrogenase small subunit (CoxS/CutS family)